MYTRQTQPAAGPRAAGTYVVDLTSVCVRSGTLRLPLSLIGRFGEGEQTVIADGEELKIDFQAPRTLSGLAPFFERAELKPNDRVRFEFDGDRLLLQSQKRQASRGSKESPGAGAAAPVTAASERTGSAAVPPSRLTARGLFPAPSQLLESGAEAQPANDGGNAQASQPEQVVRAVKRVRIEGGLPPRSDTVPPKPRDLASSREVWARRQQASWRSLDTTIAGPVVPPEEAAEAFSESTVRVVRRSQGTSTPLEAEAPLPGDRQPAARPAAPVSYATSWPLEDRPQAAPPAAREVVRQRAAPERVEPHPYLDAPVDADKEADYVPSPAILESDLLRIPTSGQWREASEAAYLKYQEGAADDLAPVPTERRQGLLGRLGLGRGAREATPPAQADADRSDASRHTRAGDSPAGGAGAGPKGPKAQAAAYPGSSAAQAVIVDESVYDVDFDAEVQPQLTGYQGGATSLEADMNTLRAFLNQPDVPAIVRCDDLAGRLSMSQERVSLAMARLAEDRERFTPLRGDAYMVRRGH